MQEESIGARTFTTVPTFDITYYSVFQVCNYVALCALAVASALVSLNVINAE